MTKGPGNSAFQKSHPVETRRVHLHPVLVL